MAASIFGVALGLASSVVIARALGPEAKGTYDLVLSTGVLLALVLGLSMPGGITFSIARSSSSVRPLLGWILAFGLAQGVIALAVITVLGHFDADVAIGVEQESTLIRWLLPILVTALCIGPCLRAILVGRQRLAEASWLDLAGRIIGFLVVLIVVVRSADRSPTVNQMLVALVIGTTIGTVVYLPAIFKLKTSAQGAGIRSIFRFSIPSYGSNVVQYLNYRIDVFFVAYFGSLRDVGLYTLAVSLAQLVWLVSNAVASAVFARVGALSDAPDIAAKTSAALARSVMLVQIALVVFLAAVSLPLIDLLYGDAFRGAAPALLLLLPGVAVFGGATILAAHIAGMGRPSLNLWVAVASLVVTLVLNVALIPRFGIAGAAIASTASYVATWLLTAAFFARATNLVLRTTLVPTRRDVQGLSSRAAAMIRGARR